MHFSSGPSALRGLSLLPSLALVHAQVQLLNVTATPDLSSTCVAVLNQQVACDPTLDALGDATQGSPVFGTPLFLTSDQLTSLCTTTCTSSLSTWQRRVSGACGSTLYNTPDGGKYIMASLVENYIEIYNSVCLKNSAGAYCNRVIGDLLHIDPSNQKATGTPAPDIYCNDCYLSLASTQLAMPMASTSLLQNKFSAITSLCKKTGWTLPSPPTSTTFTIPPTNTQPPSPTCSGAKYTISSSDTCTGISMNKGISTDDLSIYNSLSAFCRDFPTSGTLCLPDTRICTPYTVQKNDTCSSLQKQFNIFYAQLIAWNPSLGAKCSNIAHYVGYVICVSNPGGKYVNPSPTKQTTTTAATSLWTYTLPDMSSYPNATYVPTSDTAPYADQTRLDCANYFTAPILTNYTGNGTRSLDCKNATDQFGISMSDFLSWNPSLATLNPCVMANNTQYCAQTYTKTSANMTSACVMTELAPPGFDCMGFTAYKGIDQDQFVLWNPEVGSDCKKFKVGTKYCIEVQHYRQPGITSNCNKFITPNTTNWAELPCQIIETNFGLSHARFVAWNPSVLQNCTGLYYGYDYCVSIPNYQPTYSTTKPAIAAMTVAQITSSSLNGSGDGSPTRTIHPAMTDLARLEK